MKEAKLPTKYTLAPFIKSSKIRENKMTTCLGIETQIVKLQRTTKELLPHIIRQTMVTAKVPGWVERVGDVIQERLTRGSWVWI